MQRILSLFLFIVLMGIVSTLGVFAQTKPNLVLNPTVVEENTPYTLLATGCPANQPATFTWEKNNTITQQVTANAQGIATYRHQAGYSDGKYTVTISCGGQEDTKELTAIGGECKYVQKLSTDTPQPHTTTTAFTFTGKILNCPNYVGVGIQLRGENTTFSKNISTDADGNFTISNAIIKEAGTTKIHVFSLTDGPLPGDNALELTITEPAEDEQLACGDPAGENDTRCPADCPAVSTPDGWFCEAITCKPAEEVIDDLNACNSAKLLKETVACDGDVGVGCEDKDSTLCYDGEQTVKNIKCETKEKAPTPTPPFPHCLIGQDAEGNKYDLRQRPEDAEHVTKCIVISTAVRDFNLEPAGLVRGLFSILISISGGIALLLIIRSGYQIMTSKGDPEQLKEARERLTSAIIGLLFLIFSLVILQVIGVDILHIPGLSS